MHYYRANVGATSYSKTVLSSPTLFAQASSFADINNDGWLDIFACHDDAENIKFRNSGTGTFTADSTLIDTRTTPVSDNSGNYGVVWTDYDNDGDLDMYLSKCRTGVSSSTDPRRVNKLMRNNGDGTFTDVAVAAGLAFGEQSWTADFADIDNDGDLDAFIGNHMAASYLMRNNGNGTFTNITASAGVSSVTWRVMQSIFRDFNNDGWVDLLLTGEQQQLWLNDRDGTFTLIANPFNSLVIESAAVGDLNRDGYTDIYAGYANLYNSPNTARPDKLFEAVPNGNGFYSITLRGRISNRTGSGSRIELQGAWGTQVREVRSGEGYGITNSFTQIFGMGNAPSASMLRVKWPSGVVDEAYNLPANRFVTLVEGATAPPTLVNPGPQTNTIGDNVTLALSASDPTSDTLTFAAVNLPTGLAINTSTGVITGSLPAGSQGTYSVTISVTDGWSIVTRPFTWTVNAPLTAAMSTASPAVSGVFTINVTFSQPVANVNASFFNLSNATILGISGSGTQWVLTVQGTSAGNTSVGFGSSVVSVYYDPPGEVKARVQFQPAGTPLAAGSIPDHGRVFAQRSGLKYGWSTEHGSATRRRGIQPDVRDDCLIIMGTSALWEMEVPNGQYDVTCTVGDPGEASDNTLSVEGTLAFSSVKLRAGKSSVQTRRVTVMDGRLSVSNGGSTRLRSVDIVPAGMSLPATLSGLTGMYYYGSNFNQFRFMRADTVVDFDWGTSSPDPRLPVDEFSVRWTGTMIPRFSEAHTFTTTSAGGVRLWVNGALVIDQWSQHAESQHSGSAALTAGVAVPIRLDYSSASGAALARMEWSSASGARRVVPSPYLGLDAAASTSVFSGTATANADLDYGTDLLEYAMGTSAASGVQTERPLRLETTGSTSVAAVLRRPSAVTDVTYTLETSSDLVTWTPVSISPTVTTLNDLTTQHRWSAIHTAPGVNLNLGLVRCRVTLSNGSTTTTTPLVWQTYSLSPGNKTLGVNTVRPPLYSGVVGNVVGSTIQLVDESNLAAMFDPETSYYLEVRNGAFAGQRYELTGATGNTLTTSVPPVGIVGARVVVRPHITIGQVLSKDVFVGSLNPLSADQVMFHQGNAFQSYFFVSGANTYDHWTSMNDASLASSDRLVIPPASGLMVKVAGTQTRTLLLTGEVRMEPFRRQLVTGNNFLANPWPVELTPVSAALLVANGFTGTASPTSADQISIWGGDLGTAGYISYWLANVSTYRYWTALSDANLTSVNNTLKLLPGRAYFIRAQPNTVLNPWRVPLVGSMNP
jgi:hypothetical protein